MVFTGRQQGWSDKIPQVQGNAKTRFLWACSSGLSHLTCRWGWGAGAPGWGWTSQPQSAHPPDGEPWGEPQRQGRPRPSALPSSRAANRLENQIKVFSPGQLPPTSKNPVPTDALGSDTLKRGQKRWRVGEEESVVCRGNLLKVKCFVMIDSCSALKKKKKSKESPFSSSPYTLCCFPRALFSSFCQVSDCACVMVMVVQSSAGGG